MPRKPDPSLTVKEHFARLVHELYSLGDGRDGSQAWQLHCSRVRGFQECGRLLGLMSLEDVQTILMDTPMRYWTRAVSHKWCWVNTSEVDLEKTDLGLSWLWCVPFG